MCEYCEKGKVIQSNNFCGSANMKVSESKEFSILDVWGDESTFHLFKKIYRPRFDIKYCPMCGRKLNQEDSKMINNWSLIEEVINKIKSITKEDIDKILEELDKSDLSDRIEIVKEKTYKYDLNSLENFLKSRFEENIQCFNNFNWTGDSTDLIYNFDNVQVYYCADYNYLEIIGLTLDDFEYIRKLMENRR